MHYKPCPNCGGTDLFQSKPISAGGGHAPNYLQGLGPWDRAEKFTVVVCRACGLSRFFASEEARQRLSQSDKWSRVM